MKFQLHLKTKKLKNKDFFLSNSQNLYIMLIYVKMPTIVGILTLMSMINFVLSLISMKKVLLPRALSCRLGLTSLKKYGPRWADMKKSANNGSHLSMQDRIPL